MCARKQPDASKHLDRSSKHVMSRKRHVPRKPKQYSCCGRQLRSSSTSTAWGCVDADTQVPLWEEYHAFAMLPGMYNATVKITTRW